jgi:hypothetical protein
MVAIAANRAPVSIAIAHILFCGRPPEVAGAIVQFIAITVSDLELIA